MVEELTELHELWQELNNAQLKYKASDLMGQFHKNELYGGSFVVARLCGAVDDKTWNEWINREAK